MREEVTLSTPHVSESVQDSSSKLIFGPLYHSEFGEVHSRSGQSDGEMNMAVAIKIPTSIILRLTVTLMTAPTNIK